MSFILDALRKSETERQQSQGFRMARIPSAMPQQGLPTWAVATMAALAVGVVVLAGAWIKTVAWPEGAAIAARGGADSATAAGDYAVREPSRQEPASGSAARSDGVASRRIEPLPLPPAQPSSPSERVVAQSGRASPAAELGDVPSLGGAASAGAELGRSSPANVSARSDGVSPLAAAAQTPLALAARTEPRDARSSAGSASAQRPALPSVEAVLDPYHVVAASLGLPPLTLELHAFGPTPDQQFVFINGARYQAGDTLPTGARVIAINARGAVLLVGNRQLQLEPR